MPKPNSSTQAYESLQDFYRSEPEKIYAQDIKKANSSVFRSFRQYIMEGTHTGHFVEACLKDSLTGAYGRADQWMRAALYQVSLYLANCAPTACWGSEEQVENWQESGGLVGQYGEDRALTIAADNKL